MNKNHRKYLIMMGYIIDIYGDYSSSPEEASGKVELMPKKTTCIITGSTNKLIPISLS